MAKRIRRALVSVFDKEGVVDFCRRLAKLNIELISSGGTASLLEKSGLEVIRVADYTGFPEMLDGRVKTLHPRIHAGILAIRGNSAHMSALAKHDIAPIDLVVVNLYPFEKTVAADGVTREEAVEMIDIGGPSMVRSAAKNHTDVGVIVNPGDYEKVASELEENEGVLSAGTRLRLSSRAFGHTASYDRAIHAYLSSAAAGEEEQAEVEGGLPERLRLAYRKIQEMRYGENPHQQAAFYSDPHYEGPAVGSAEQLQGKELSFNNILDLDAALGQAAEFSDCACVIIKHGNPCGTALGASPRAAYEAALACDPVSAFGGVVAFNRRVDAGTAGLIAEHFFECLIAPSFDDDARQVLGRKKKLRLLETGDLARYRRHGFDLRRVNGGMLLQEWDEIGENVRECRVATKRAPTDEEWKALEFAWTVCKNVKSNAIVYALADRTVGIGAGQMSRVDSARIAIMKAQVSLKGAVMASDAFFPFRDGLDVAAEAGIEAVIQPGGSIRDKEVIAAADEHGMAMVLTGRRHFRH
jgi:phosphoribosylaminoimidazolecarboxamide formyltransferase/IMP cyclohydrolase